MKEKYKIKIIGVRISSTIRYLLNNTFNGLRSFFYIHTRFVLLFNNNYTSLFLNALKDIQQKFNIEM